MTANKYILLSALFFASCAPVTKVDGNYNLVSFDGKRTISIDTKQKVFRFGPTQPVTSESKDKFGGSLKNCSGNGINCVALESIVLAVPCTAKLAAKWNAEGAEFSVVGHYWNGQRTIDLIQATKADDMYVSFSYSYERGVESVSLRESDQEAWIATTYFADGQHGLLQCEKPDPIAFLTSQMKAR